MKKFATEIYAAVRAKRLTEPSIQALCKLLAVAPRQSACRQNGGLSGGADRLLRDELFYVFAYIPDLFSWP